MNSKICFLLAVCACLQYVQGEGRSMKYVGCYKDSWFNRDLEERRWDDDNMTLEKCANHCNGYRYFGVQAGDECRCANGYGERGEDRNGCKEPCEGNSAQTCGDSWRNSVYEINAVEPVMKYMGCFKDKLFDRDLTERSWSSNHMTLELCASHCKGYTYMATQWHEQCRCGNRFGEHGEDSNGCDDACDGNGQQRCGGSWRNSVYKIHHDIEHMTFEAVGDSTPRKIHFNGNSKLIIPDWTNGVKSVTGKVIRWLYSSNDTLPVHLGFFRQSKDAQTLFRYIGGTDFNPSQSGDHIINLYGNNQIDVLEGDVLGIYRPPGAPYEYSRYRGCTGRTHFLFTVREDGNFTRGELVTLATRNHCGIPYVAADIRDI